MKTDKTKLLQDIEAMKEKLASMEEELNKSEEFKHFPSKYEEYYFYDTKGSLIKTYSVNDDIRINAYKTRKEAQKAYNKAIALEKIKRRIIELQGDWKPTWEDYSYKYTIDYNYNIDRFEDYAYIRLKFPILIPYMKTGDIAKTIIEEMEDELKLIFDIA